METGAALPVLERTTGRLALSLKAAGGVTRLDGLAPEGALRAFLPRRTQAATAEAMLVNTAGGLTGGDRLDLDIRLGPGTRAVVTTQGAERVYRSAAGEAVVETRLQVEAGATLAWLPQETILFEGSRLRRRLDVDLAPDASCLLVEPLALGRLAHGERLTKGGFVDHWRVRQGGRLVFAEATRFAGDIAPRLGRRAALGGAAALATVVWAGAGAATLLDPLRALLLDVIAKDADAIAEGAASLVAGVLVVRLLAADLWTLKRALVRLLAVLWPEGLPRAWAL